MISIVVIFVAVLYFVYKLLFNKHEKNDFPNIPGPPGLPIIGNIKDILADRVTIFYKTRTWALEHQGFYSLRLFSFLRTVEISNPQDVEKIISTPTHNKKSKFYDFLHPWLQEGLLVSTGSKWHERRKILTPTFHFNILRQFTTIFEENSNVLVKNLEKEVEKSKTNIVPLISEYTLNSICETAMGTKLDDGSSDMGIEYKKAVYDMGTYVVERLTRAWLHVDWIFQLSSLGRQQKNTLTVIRRFPNRVINERKLYKEKEDDHNVEEFANTDDVLMNPKRKMAMLDLLLLAEKENRIDRKGIQEEVDTFMFEGHDTTSVGLTFAFLELANHQDFQDRIAEEIRSIIGESDRVATMEDLNQMKYLDCFIKETLRLYPPVPFIGRRIAETVKLNNYIVPAGTTCHIHIFDLHRNPKLYKDPLVFDPDRFLPENSIDRHPYAYLPFSAGPRNCIGQRFAVLEMKSAISAVLRRFELKPITKSSDVVFSADLVLRSAHPIHVAFTKRYFLLQYIFSKIIKLNYVIVKRENVCMCLFTSSIYLN